MDDFDDDDEGGEGGLFRRRMILQEVTPFPKIFNQNQARITSSLNISDLLDIEMQLK